MKMGRTLQEVAVEIERQRNSQKDFVADTKAIGVRAHSEWNSDGSGTLIKRGIDLVLKDQDYLVGDVAHDQLIDETAIPAKYYRRMLAESPELLASNVGHWFKANAKPRMIRTLDGRARAVLSPSYRPLSNCDLAEAVIPTLMELKLDIKSCEITEKRLYIKAIDPRFEVQVPKGRKMGQGHEWFDYIQPAIVISNSEVGYGRLSVESGIYTRACTNLAVIESGSVKRTHLGARHQLTENVENIDHLLSSESRKATDRAIWMQIRDVVKGCFDETMFRNNAKKLETAGQDIIDGDPIKTLDLTAKQFGFTDNERGSVLKHLIAGSDLTRYGLFNAITRTAQDADSYDRATELEHMGGRVIELAPQNWKELSAA